MTKKRPTTKERIIKYLNTRKTPASVESIVKQTESNPHTTRNY